MPDYDVKYFEALLEKSRAECLKYEVPSSVKDAMFPIMQTQQGFLAKRDEAENAKSQVKRRQNKGEATKEEFEAAEKHYKELKKEAETQLNPAVDALVPFLENDIRLDLEPTSLHVELMKCEILSRQTPKELAKFCQEHGHETVDELLGNPDMMKELLVQGGAKNAGKGRNVSAKFMEAYKLFDELMELLEAQDESLNTDCHRRLAMAVALEFATPLQAFKSKDKFIDPKQRFLHFVQAHANGELDPAFPYFTTWEFRHIVNADATDEELQWGRDQMKRYSPRYLVTNQQKFQYVMQVRDEMPVCNPKWGEGGPTYRKLLSEGGKCGPRAWFGRFICKAFGVPTWGVKQPGHAAMSRWTPKNGWVTALGAALLWSHWEGRHGHDFKFEAHARYFQQDLETYFLKVTLLQCMATAHKEPSIAGDWVILSTESMFRSLARVQLKHWCDQAEAKGDQGIFERGPKDGQEPEDCDIRRFLQRKDQPKKDNKIDITDDGLVRIPACAATKTEDVAVGRCFEGGGQINFNRKSTGLIEYKLPSTVPRKQYEISFKICTVHSAQVEDSLCVSVNGAEAVKIPVLYTVGDWAQTTPVAIDLGGDDEIKITRESPGGSFFGIALKELTLKGTP